MDLSPENFVTVNQILADVLKVVKDSSFKLNSRGWYISQIQQALEELSFDTFFDERNMAFDVPEDLRLDMPKGAFNLRDIFLFNGDVCTISNSVNVWSKSGMINGKSGNGFVARDTGVEKNDPFYRRDDVLRANNQSADAQLAFNDPQNQSRGTNGLYFASIQNGTIMFSQSCRKFQKVMVVYNGIMTDIGEAPIVPQFFRQAVKDFVLVPALETKATDKVGTNEYGHWMGLMNKYQNSKDHPYDGTWIKAERRATVLNTKNRLDMKEYMSRLNY